MIFKKTVSAISMVMSFAGISLTTQCTPENQGDKDPVVKCDTTGYKKAGMAAKSAKGTFFTCGGPKCKIVSKFPDRVNPDGTTSSNATSTRNVKYPGRFVVDKSAKSWKATDCGTIYKKA